MTQMMDRNAVAYTCTVHEHIAATCSKTEFTVYTTAYTSPLSTFILDDTQNTQFHTKQ